ncbi:MAG TPA: response regulator transcription factor, partial [Opitutus sp.]|nr:response regulator transcription factor [Opitutus sp.]
MTRPLPRILLVEDDRQLIYLVRVTLERKGYRVFEAFDGPSGLESALKERPDLLVLDIDLPGLNGLEVCEELRRLHYSAPILMLTGRAQLDEKVAGLESGADDYLAKPFEPREFLARVQALLRRHQRDEAPTPTLDLGDVRIDLRERTATRNGQALTLTKTEFGLLELLAKTPGQPVSRETILDIVWGYARFPTTRTVDTHIWRLRKKIGDDGDEPRWI